MKWGPKNAPFEAVEELQQVLGMTAHIYESVAPFLTIYSIGLAINPSLADEELIRFFREAGLGSQFFVNSPGTVYSIRAEAKGPYAAFFVREAVVKLPRRGVPQILSWRQGARKNTSYLGSMQSKQ